MTTLQVRVDKKTKEKARKVFASLGIDMSTGIKLYLQQVNLRKGLPFLLTTQNGLTVQKEQEILCAAQEAAKGKNVTKVMTQDEAIKYLDNMV